MRIIIAAHNLRAGGGISVGQNIISAIGRSHPQHHYMVTAPVGLGYEQVCRDIPQAEIALFPHRGKLGRRFLYETFELPAMVRRFDADAALCLGNIALKKTGIPQALLLHNSFYVYPSKHYGRAATLRLHLLVAIQRLQFAHDLRRIRLLLCQTEAMTARVRNAYDYQGPTRICPNAVSRFTLEGDDGDKPPLPEGLQRVASKRLLFCLTAYYPHKNLEAVVDLFHQKRGPLRDYAAILTIDREQGVGANKLLDSIQRLGLEDSIINVGPLPQQALSSYFAHSHALLMPTLLESFSGTYLEAMHFGLPILTSDLDFAHEVCGNAALFFDPHNPGSILDAILKIKENPNLATSLSERGKDCLNAMEIAWDDIAFDLLNELTSLVNKQA